MSDSQPPSGKANFNIPKIRKQVSKDNLRSLNINNRDAQEILSTATRTHLDPSYNGPWEVKAVKLVNNKELEEQYRTKRAELKEQGRHARDLQEQFMFLSFRDEKIITSISQSGLKTKTSPFNNLGENEHGVYICRHADVQLKLGENWNSDACYVVVFKVTLGRCKILTTLDSKGVEPAPNFDCHIYKSKATPSDSLPQQISKSQVYLYEYNDDCDLEERPRHCLPHAIITYGRTNFSSSTDTKTSRYNTNQQQGYRTNDNTRSSTKTIDREPSQEQKKRPEILPSLVQRTSSGEFSGMVPVLPLGGVIFPGPEDPRFQRPLSGDAEDHIHERHAGHSPRARFDLMPGNMEATFVGMGRQTSLPSDTLSSQLSGEYPTTYSAWKAQLQGHRRASDDDIASFPLVAAGQSVPKNPRDPRLASKSSNTNVVDMEIDDNSEDEEVKIKYETSKKPVESKTSSKKVKTQISFADYKARKKQKDEEEEAVRAAREEKMNSDQQKQELPSPAVENANVDVSYLKNTPDTMKIPDNSEQTENNYPLTVTTADMAVKTVSSDSVISQYSTASQCSTSVQSSPTPVTYPDNTQTSDSSKELAEIIGKFESIPDVDVHLKNLDVLNLKQILQSVSNVTGTAQQNTQNLPQQNNMAIVNQTLLGTDPTKVSPSVSQANVESTLSMWYNLSQTGNIKHHDNITHPETYVDISSHHGSQVSQSEYVSDMDLRNCLSVKGNNSYENIVQNPTEHMEDVDLRPHAVRENIALNPQTNIFNVGDDMMDTDLRVKPSALVNKHSDSGTCRTNIFQVGFEFGRQTEEVKDIDMRVGDMGQVPSYNVAPANPHVHMQDTDMRMMPNKSPSAVFKSKQSPIPSNVPLSFSKENLKQLQQDSQITNSHDLSFLDNVRSEKDYMSELFNRSSIPGLSPAETDESEETKSNSALFLNLDKAHDVKSTGDILENTPSKDSSEGNSSKTSEFDDSFGTNPQDRSFGADSISTEASPVKSFNEYTRLNPKQLKAFIESQAQMMKRIQGKGKPNGDQGENSRSVSPARESEKKTIRGRKSSPGSVCSQNSDSVTETSSQSSAKKSRAKFNKDLIGYRKRRRRKKTKAVSDTSSDRTGDHEIDSITSSDFLDDTADIFSDRSWVTPTPSECAEPAQVSCVDYLTQSAALSLGYYGLTHWSQALNRPDFQPQVLVSRIRKRRTTDPDTWRVDETFVLKENKPSNAPTKQKPVTEADEMFPYQKEDRVKQWIQVAKKKIKLTLKPTKDTKTMAHTECSESSSVVTSLHQGVDVSDFTKDTSTNNSYIPTSSQKETTEPMCMSKKIDNLKSTTPFPEKKISGFINPHVPVTTEINKPLPKSWYTVAEHKGPQELLQDEDAPIPSQPQALSRDKEQPINIMKNAAQGRPPVQSLQQSYLSTPSLPVPPTRLPPPSMQDFPPQHLPGSVRPQGIHNTQSHVGSPYSVGEMTGVTGKTFVMPGNQPRPPATQHMPAVEKTQPVHPPYSHAPPFYPPHTYVMSPSVPPPSHITQPSSQLHPASRAALSMPQRLPYPVQSYPASVRNTQDPDLSVPTQNPGLSTPDLRYPMPVSSSMSVPPAQSVPNLQTPRLLVPATVGVRQQAALATHLGMPNVNIPPPQVTRTMRPPPPLVQPIRQLQVPPLRTPVQSPSSVPLRSPVHSVQNVNLRNPMIPAPVRQIGNPQTRLATNVPPGPQQNPQYWSRPNAPPPNAIPSANMQPTAQNHVVNRPPSIQIPTLLNRKSAPLVPGSPHQFSMQQQNQAPVPIMQHQAPGRGPGPGMYRPPQIPCTAPPGVMVYPHQQPAPYPPQPQQIPGHSPIPGTPPVSKKSDVMDWFTDKINPKKPPMDFNAIVQPGTKPTTPNNSAHDLINMAFNTPQGPNINIQTGHFLGGSSQHMCAGTPHSSIQGTSSSSQPSLIKDHLENDSKDIQSTETLNLSEQTMTRPSELKSNRGEVISAVRNELGINQSKKTDTQSHEVYAKQQQDSLPSSIVESNKDLTMNAPSTNEKDSANLKDVKLSTNAMNKQSETSIMKSQGSNQKTMISDLFVEICDTSQKSITTSTSSETDSSVTNMKKHTSTISVLTDEQESSSVIPPVSVVLANSASDTTSSLANLKTSCTLVSSSTLTSTPLTSVSSSITHDETKQLLPTASARKAQDVKKIDEMDILKTLNIESLKEMNTETLQALLNKRKALVQELDMAIDTVSKGREVDKPPAEDTTSKTLNKTDNKTDVSKMQHSQDILPAQRGEAELSIRSNSKEIIKPVVLNTSTKTSIGAGNTKHEHECVSGTEKILPFKKENDKEQKRRAASEENRESTDLKRSLKKKKKDIIDRQSSRRANSEENSSCTKIKERDSRRYRRNESVYDYKTGAWVEREVRGERRYRYSDEDTSDKDFLDNYTDEYESDEEVFDYRSGAWIEKRDSKSSESNKTSDVSRKRKSEDYDKKDNIDQTRRKSEEVEMSNHNVKPKSQVYDSMTGTWVNGSSTTSSDLDSSSSLTDSSPIKKIITDKSKIEGTYSVKTGSWSSAEKTLKKIPPVKSNEMKEKSMQSSAGDVRKHSTATARHLSRKDAFSKTNAGLFSRMPDKGRKLSASAHSPTVYSSENFFKTDSQGKTALSKQLSNNKAEEGNSKEINEKVNTISKDHVKLPSGQFSANTPDVSSSHWAEISLRESQLPRDPITADSSENPSHEHSSAFDDSKECWRDISSKGQVGSFTIRLNDKTQRDQHTSSTFDQSPEGQSKEGSRFRSKDRALTHSWDDSPRRHDQSPRGKGEYSRQDSRGSSSRYSDSSKHRRDYSPKRSRDSSPFSSRDGSPRRIMDFSPKIFSKGRSSSGQDSSPRVIDHFRSKSKDEIRRGDGFRSPRDSRYDKDRYSRESQYDRDRSPRDSRYDRGRSPRDSRYDRGRSPRDSRYDRGRSPRDSRYDSDRSRDSRNGRDRSPRDSRYDRHRSPRYDRDRSPRGSKYDHDRSPRDSKYVRERSPPGSRDDGDRSPRESRHGRDISPRDSRYIKERSTRESRYDSDKSPRDSSYGRDRSPVGYGTVKLPGDRMEHLPKTDIDLRSPRCDLPEKNTNEISCRDLDSRDLPLFEESKLDYKAMVQYPTLARYHSNRPEEMLNKNKKRVFQENLRTNQTQKDESSDRHYHTIPPSPMGANDIAQKQGMKSKSVFDKGDQKFISSFQIINNPESVNTGTLVKIPGSMSSPYSPRSPLGSPLADQPGPIEDDLLPSAERIVEGFSFTIRDSRSSSRESSLYRPTPGYTQNQSREGSVEQVQRNPSSSKNDQLDEHSLEFLAKTKEQLTLALAKLSNQNQHSDVESSDSIQEKVDNMGSIGGYSPLFKKTMTGNLQRQHERVNYDRKEHQIPKLSKNCEEVLSDSEIGENALENVSDSDDSQNGGKQTLKSYKKSDRRIVVTSGETRKRTELVNYSDLKNFNEDSLVLDRNQNLRYNRSSSLERVSQNWTQIVNNPNDKSEIVSHKHGMQPVRGSTGNYKSSTFVELLNETKSKINQIKNEAMNNMSSRNQSLKDWVVSEMKLDPWVFEQIQNQITIDTSVHIDKLGINRRKTLKRKLKTEVEDALKTMDRHRKIEIVHENNEVVNQKAEFSSEEYLHCKTTFPFSTIELGEEMKRIKLELQKLWKEPFETATSKIPSQLEEFCLKAGITPSEMEINKDISNNRSAIMRQDLQQLESEIQTRIRQQSKFFGKSFCRVPQELLTKVEINEFFSEEGLFLFLCTPLPEKTYNKLLHVKHQIDKLHDKLAANRDNPVQTNDIMTEKTRLHHQRRHLMCTYTGGLLKRRLNKLRIKERYYMRCYDFMCKLHGAQTESKFPYLKMMHDDLVGHIKLMAHLLAKKGNDTVPDYEARKKEREMAQRQRVIQGLISDIRHVDDRLSSVFYCCGNTDELPSSVKSVVHHVHQRVNTVTDFQNAEVMDEEVNSGLVGRLRATLKFCSKAYDFVQKMIDEFQKERQSGSESIESSNLQNRFAFHNLMMNSGKVTQS